MWNLFLKQKQETLAPIVAPRPKYNEAITQIHKDFNEASDRLIAQVNNILEIEKHKSVSKGKRLVKHGFQQAAEARDVSGIYSMAEKGREQINLLRKYSTSYPFNKFITKDQVGQLCGKYGLVCGDVSLYKGFVPERNLKEIEAFQFNDSDKEIRVWSIGVGGTWKGEEHDDDGDQAKRYPGIYKMEKRAEGLKICAPKEQMDTRKMRLAGSFLRATAPDPIVLQPVKGGYLIVTAWGDEASDPIVVNEINN